MRAAAIAVRRPVVPRGLLALLAMLATTAATADAARAQPAPSPTIPITAPDPGVTVPDTSEAVVRPRFPQPGVAFRAKKDYRLQKKERNVTDPERRRQWRQQLDERIGARPAPIVNIYSLWHHEYLPIEVNDQLRSELRRTLPRDVVPQRFGNRLLRCHFTQEPTDIDPRLLSVVTRAALHFGVDRVNVVSGYRAPKYNLILQKKGREVARTSQHSLGHAIDFRLPGVNIKRLHHFVRKLRLGGVGFYTHSKFIHADVGPVRYWTGR